MRVTSLLWFTFIKRENRLLYHKSAHGPHRRDVTHILFKVSCFFLNPFIFVGYRNDRFFAPTNPYISKSMLHNNSDVSRCSYFELGLPVFKPAERLRFTFTPNGKREFVPRDQVFPLFFVYCLLLLHKNK